MKPFALPRIVCLTCVVGTACGGGGGEAPLEKGDGGSSGGTAQYAGTMTAAITHSGSNAIYGFTAAFEAADGAGSATPSCAGTQSGSCCYVGAVSSATDAGTAATPTAVSAGALSVKDGSTVIVNLNPTSTLSYSASASNPSVKWQGGDTLTVSASGATVGAFTTALTTAADLVGVSPALSTTPVKIPIASAFTMHWTASTATSVALVVGAFKGVTEDGIITCTAADSAASITVPVALLGKFSSGDTGIISLTRTNTAKATESNVALSLASTTNVAGTATFQ